MINYDDATHTYWVEGQKCPSVTQILAWKFPKKYEMVDEATLTAAAEKGTELHNAIEIYEQYGLERDDLKEFRDYLFLKKYWKINVIENEVIVSGNLEIVDANDLITYCGRTDMVAEVEGKLTLIDIKRTATVDKEYLKYQLNLYKLAYEQTTGKKVELLKCIRLKEGKRQFIDIPVDEGCIAQLLLDYWSDHRGQQ